MYTLQIYIFVAHKKRTRQVEYLGFSKINILNIYNLLRIQQEKQCSRKRNCKRKKSCSYSFYRICWILFNRLCIGSWFSWNFEALCFTVLFSPIVILFNWKNCFHFLKNSLPKIIKFWSHWSQGKISNSFILNSLGISLCYVISCSVLPFLIFSIILYFCRFCFALCWTFRINILNHKLQIGHHSQLDVVH